MEYKDIIKKAFVESGYDANRIMEILGFLDSEICLDGGFTVELNAHTYNVTYPTVFVH